MIEAMACRSKFRTFTRAGLADGGTDLPRSQSNGPRDSNIQPACEMQFVAQVFTIAGVNRLEQANWYDIIAGGSSLQKAPKKWP